MERTVGDTLLPVRFARRQPIDNHPGTPLPRSSSSFLYRTITLRLKEWSSVHCDIFHIQRVLDYEYSIFYQVPEGFVQFVRKFLPGSAFNITLPNLASKRSDDNVLQDNFLYEGRPLPDQPTIADVRSVARDYTAIAFSVMTHIADRYERSPHRGLIDTKFDIRTGKDFSVHDPRGPHTVYGWIQGRGLEALVGHANWLRRHPWFDPDGLLLRRLDTMISEVYTKLRTMWLNNGRRLFFFLDPNGVPFVFTTAGERQPYTLSAHAPYNFSDLFGSRGLYAAAAYLGDKSGLREAAEYCLAFEDALWSGRFASDQQRLPSADPVPPPSACRRSHAPFTIQLATPALAALYERDASHCVRGLRLMEYVLAHHVNLRGRRADLRVHDFWEYVDDHGRPLVENGRLVSDPGHALEFVGLGLKLTRTARTLGMSADALAPYEAPMPGILLCSFQLGYNRRAGGIRKQIDLLTRRPVDDTMPWWSLPETMRAAILCWSVTPDEGLRDQTLAVFAACHNSFVKYYVQPERHLFAVQNRSSDGRVIDVIPATADADPGYHTGLSLLDVLDVVEEATGSLEV